MTAGSPATGGSPVRVRAVGLQMMGDKRYGTKIGRLKYRTAAEARAVAEELGLTDIHSHMMGSERVYMPGGDHQALNDALRSLGRPPTRMPGGGKMDKGAMPSGQMAAEMMQNEMTEPMTDIEPADPMTGTMGSVSDGNLGNGEVVDMDPLFDMDELTGDRDDDDEMEIY